MIYIILILALILPIHASWDGPKYAEIADPQRVIARKMLKRHKFKKEDRVLDLGCGDGALTLEIARLVPDGFVLGVDSSESMIEHAESSYDPDRWYMLQFTQGCAETLSHPNQFDHVVSFNCLHWVKDKKRAFKNIYDSLVPGGQVLISMSAQKSTPIMETLVKELSEGATWPGFYPTKEEIEACVKEAGFQEYRISMQKESCVFENRTALQKWLEGWVPEIEGVDRQSLIERSVLAYAGDDDQKKVTLPWSGIQVEGIK